jgi:isoleucyl-tRNA synthetase
MEEVILSEINVKRLEFVPHDSPKVKRQAKPNFNLIGKKYRGSEVQYVAGIIRSFDNSDLVVLEKNGSLASKDGKIEILRGEVDIICEYTSGWIVASDNEITVALDTVPTPELISEGFSREFVNRIQNLRKDSDFEVIDRIRINVDGSTILTGALKEHEHYIKNETLALDLSFGKVDAVGAAEFDLNGEKCAVKIERVPQSA